ncbi:bifunctional indole-3-glycerol phosphate synthase/phosphoribosylanthranilate isomerase [Edwardsiella hoshinae]|uniref:Multifunctional fusion protein n=1 Tax=Edwardsiella hoshinae TaxID=93378 RepID=A0ABN4SXA9_9GAMM|nr:bifunctional indole-3-glycerol-phosphate synthase TrpC/phosphoribosylanthranilate isomerase TrpF [Edwardsiella hoshinae]AOV97150.1 bifunctional indole-3-glycerol phosphate synthase/phosphoribosylanthranilate isomerase [Edwardsiella hoshinae]
MTTLTSPPSLLLRIVANKRRWIAMRQQRQPLATFRPTLQPAKRDFYHALRGERCALILECKKASPSRGVIRADFDPQAIARVYRDHAAAISVLTDSDDFQGDFAYLRAVSDVVTQPVLCKDFIIDPYQIYLARHYRADAILLILSILDDDRYRQLAAIAASLAMGVLTEVSNEPEMARALALGARVIGINNRNLHDLSVDTERTRHLAALAPASVTLIAESGIRQYAQLRDLGRRVQGFLIGSALMAQADLRAAVCRLRFGDNKICGLTRPEDAAAAYQAGAIYGGLIFAARSARCVDLATAQHVMQGAPLRYVGVFRDAPASRVALTATRLGLYAVQLHGTEDQAYIDRLRPLLPAHCQIWKALAVGDTLPARNLRLVDRYLFDATHPGGGRPFDWRLLAGQALDNVMLAGGIGADNCRQAAALGVCGLDFNSALESSPGIKARAKLQAAFLALRP